jgi:hypothetical protein
MNKLELVEVNAVPLWFRVYRCETLFTEGSAVYPMVFGLAPFSFADKSRKLKTHGCVFVKNLQRIQQPEYELEDSGLQPRLELKPETKFLARFDAITSHPESVWIICDAKTGKDLSTPKIETTWMEILIVQSLPWFTAPQIFGLIFDCLLDDFFVSNAHLQKTDLQRRIYL